MPKKFSFDFDALSFEDQKYLYRHFDIECLDEQKFESASTLAELRACFDKEGNTEAERVAYLGALIAHGLAKIEKIPEERDGEKGTFVDLFFDQDVDFLLDITDYDGLNYEGKGVIAMVETVELYRLEELGELFRNYTGVREF
jgi:hypothetical protein